MCCLRCAFILFFFVRVLLTRDCRYQSATSVAAVKTTETLAIGATATSGALGLWAGVGRGLGWVREVVVVLGTVVVGGLVV